MPGQADDPANKPRHSPEFNENVLVENADEIFASAVGAGGKVLMPVMDMFWGDRCGMVADPDGNKWMIATHKSEPTEAQMAEAMRQMQQQGPQAAAAAGD